MQLPDASAPAPQAPPKSFKLEKNSCSGAEMLSIGGLALMVISFLNISWRKWPDPIVDFGQQCYSVWRLSQGGSLYHDFIWSYGPVSIYFNAMLFRIFGPGIMVIVTANLIIYALILSLAYIALRRAWGWPGAVAALAVFISVFSFSHLLGVGNYNYATPYAAESTHGMLLALVTAFVVKAWQRKTSLPLAFVLGLCGGLSAVMKPEFMLATGVLGSAGLALRWGQHRRVTVAEFALLAAGVALPTLAFTLIFARREPWVAALIDASQAWWLVVVEHIQTESGQQASFSGLNKPLLNTWVELKAAGGGVLVMALIWAAGWLVNRSWSLWLRIVTALAAFALIFLEWKHSGWWTVGRCLPGLVAILFVLSAARVWRETRSKGLADERTVTAFLLVLLGGVMLARMPLFARVFHLGFFQAAIAAMVVTAAMVSELPRWTGAAAAGRAVSMLGCVFALALFSIPFVLKSRSIRADQTEPVGWGRDRFYSTTRTIDGTGALVNWAAEKLRTTTPDTTVLVMPEGLMINYLSRRKSLEPGWTRYGTEALLLEQMRQHPPDYFVVISRDLTDLGGTQFGAPGNFGYDMIQWVHANYALAAKAGGNPLAADDHPGAEIWRHKQGDAADAAHSPTR